MLVKLISAVLLCFETACQEQVEQGCHQPEDDEAGLAQVRLRQQSGTSAAGAAKWSLLNPNPDVLEWVFSGYYVGMVSSLPPGLCSFHEDNATGACTEEQMRNASRKYGQPESEFKKLHVGYLSVPLSYDTDSNANKITLRLRVSAIVGKAGVEAEPLLLHGGGPGTVDTYAMSVALDPTGLADSMTYMGIQQRGMSMITAEAEYLIKIYPSRADPHDILDKTVTGVCDETKYTLPPVEENRVYTLRDFTSCVCDVGDDHDHVIPDAFPAPDKEDEVASWMAFDASRGLACYDDGYWKMSSGSEEFNFLDFIGTQMLAQDLNRLRAALGYRHLNINGLSYGTAVGGTYLTAFPKQSRNVVLNGNVFPGGGVLDFWMSEAQASRQTMSKLEQICQNMDNRKQILGNCMQIEDVVSKIQFQIISGHSPYALPTKSGSFYRLTPAMLYNYINKKLASMLAEQAQPWKDVLKVLSGLRSENLEEMKKATKEIFDVNCNEGGVSYWSEYGYCPPVMMLSRNNNNDNWIATRTVRALDYAGRYTLPSSMDWYRKLAREYRPVEVYFANVKGGFGFPMWPNQPTPCMYNSRAGVRPLIVNALYDGATGWSNAYLMRAGFPDGALMTWQGVGHCVSTADFNEQGVAGCSKRINHYLNTGELPVDGFTCRQTQPIK